MTFRSTPRAATWFLREYCPNPQDDSVIGDLTEEYQRGRSSTWYCRQVLAIVFVGLYREIRLKPRAVIGGLVKAWIVQGIMQLCIVIPIFVKYASDHPSREGFTGSGFPLLSIRIGTEIQWPVTVLTAFLSLVLLGMIGMDLASSPRVRPRALVLTYAILFVCGTIASIAIHTQELFLNQPNAAGFLLLNLFALPMAPAALLWGASLRKQKTEAGSAAS
jgi:hypothetical protein